MAHTLHLSDSIVAWCRLAHLQQRAGLLLKETFVTFFRPRDPSCSGGSALSGRPPFLLRRVITLAWRRSTSNESPSENPKSNRCRLAGVLPVCRRDRGIHGSSFLRSPNVFRRLNEFAHSRIRSRKRPLCRRRAGVLPLAGIVEFRSDLGKVEKPPPATRRASINLSFSPLRWYNAGAYGSQSGESIRPCQIEMRRPSKT